MSYPSTCPNCNEKQSRNSPGRYRCGSWIGSGVLRASDSCRHVARIQEITELRQKVRRLEARIAELEGKE